MQGCMPTLGKGMSTLRKGKTSFYRFKKLRIPVHRFDFLVSPPLGAEPIVWYHSDTQFEYFRISRSVMLKRLQVLSSEDSIIVSFEKCNPKENSVDWIGLDWTRFGRRRPWASNLGNLMAWDSMRA
jgi:hypothetical protein